MDTVGILDAGKVTDRLMVLARRTGKLTFDGTAAATAAVLALSQKRCKLERERMEKAGAPAQSIKVWFWLASKVAPRIEDAVKARATHDEAMAEIRAQLAKLMGGTLNAAGDPVGLQLTWREFQDFLQGKVTADGKAEEGTDAKADQQGSDVRDATADQMKPEPHKVSAGDVCEYITRGDFTVEELTAIVKAASAILATAPALQLAA